jgi:hypothetical protein
VVVYGGFELLLADHPTVWAFRRPAPTADLLVAANFSSLPLTVALPLGPEWEAARPLLSNLPGPVPVPVPTLSLPAWGSAVWRLGH